MNIKLVFTALFIHVSACSQAQNGWTVCTAPYFASRIDDIFIIDGKTGYAVCGTGQIIKSVDSGNTWTTVFRDKNIYYRSVEFINAQKGFVGGFNPNGIYKDVFLKTVDGGFTWIDLTNTLDPLARNGICGLSAADSNTIYGCGNWYKDSAYIIKSTDGGNTWQLIPMYQYASSLIDMYFLNKDTGFVTGKTSDSLNTAVIFYTTDGGKSWVKKFQNTDPDEYCWKIQRLTDRIYFASIEDLGQHKPSILKSTDGGMSWTKYFVYDVFYNIEGIGFIDSLRGFTGGGDNNSFESDDGGITWKQTSICPFMNRVFRVSDSVMFATGDRIWKYVLGTKGYTGPGYNPVYTSLKCFPNPVNGILTIDANLSRSTHAMLILFDDRGHRIKVIDNADKSAGNYIYQLNTDNMAQGVYFVLLKTHEDQQVVKVLVSH
ncbi:MAG TPA: T9SS type A sorting domain-containing protein [Puia sp.]|nr:T9SS type A sorting domain-containing protein [Puia sp.]